MPASDFDYPNKNLTFLAYPKKSPWCFWIIKLYYICEKPKNMPTSPFVLLKNKNKFLEILYTGKINS